jgi:hypothetical protein
MQRKALFTAVGTLITGAAVAWAVTADIYEKKIRSERAMYDQMIKDKTNHIWLLQERVEWYWANTKKDSPAEVSDDQMDIGLWGMAEPYDKVTVPIMDEAPVVEDEDLQPAEVILEQEKSPKSNVQSLIDAYAADQDVQAAFAEMVAEDESNDKAPPFVISRGTYTWDEEGESYDKITVKYFPRDRVLLDDDDDPIEDVGRIVGWRNLTRFGHESEDPDVVFVRNRHMQTDFEVVKEEDSQLPLHVKYGMEKEEFRVNRAAGLIKLRAEDDDN